MLGDCFRAAALALEDVGRTPGLEARLVHGYVVGTSGYVAGVRYPHAWVETKAPGDLLWTCVDRSCGRDIAIPDALYYLLGTVERDACRYYSGAEARRMLLDTGVYGPWGLDPALDESHLAVARLGAKDRRRVASAR